MSLQFIVKGYGRTRMFELTFEAVTSSLTTNVFLQSVPCRWPV